MNELELKIEVAILNMILLPMTEEGESEFTVAYGYIEEKMGWHLIIADYPSYNILFMGATVAEATVFATDMIKEE